MVQQAPSTPAILLIEDNPDDELLALRAFSRAGVKDRIDVARDGVEALEYLFGEGRWAGRASDPRLVLLDLKLPRLDGLDVLRRLRADPRTQLLRVVILTSSREERDLLDGYSSGATGYVVKPVDFEQFVEAARSLGRYWLALNEPPPRKA